MDFSNKPRLLTIAFDTALGDATRKKLKYSIVKRGDVSETFRQVDRDGHSQVGCVLRVDDFI